MKFISIQILLSLAFSVNVMAKLMAPTNLRLGGTPPADGATITTIEISSNVGTTAMPFSIGHSFRKGDVPAANTVFTDIVESQIDIKNRWPDGSVKFGIISGLVTLTSNVKKVVSIKSTSQTISRPANLTTTDLKATGITAALQFGSLSATWSATDWDMPNKTWVSGPYMSSWIFRKPLGADAHLVGSLEVRLFRGGKVEVLPYIENGYLQVAGPTKKSGRAQFILNGSVRYDSINDSPYNAPYGFEAIGAGGVINMAHHTRIVLVRAGVLSHWLGSDPQIIARANVKYLQATKVVPNYRPPSINEVELANLTKNYSPMRVVYMDEGMGSTGYDSGIGMLPNESAKYLVSGDQRAYKAVMQTGFALGSYSIHYRDETTQRPLNFASYPTKTVQDSSLPEPSGGSPYAYASSHHPAAAYLPYLISGWHWYLEEIQFQVTIHYLSRSIDYRHFEKYYFYPSAWLPGGNEQGGVRAQAWQWRTMSMATSLIPDNDPMKSAYTAVINYNANYFRTHSETGTWERNNLGLVTTGLPGGTPAGAQVIGAPWNDDFMTAVVGLTWDLEIVTDPAKKADLLWFRDFKYKSIVGRLGGQGATEWCYRQAANYNIPYGIATGNDVTFNWFSDWGAAYINYFGKANDCNSGTDLVGGNIGGGAGMSQSYWGNLQPAISYAVDHGAPGALTGYNRMVNASNYSTNAAEFLTTPVWGIKPRTTSN
jgi:hypothetical protein